jgi:hypothetical protein
LGSDDEVDDVVADCKIRIYIDKKNQVVNAPKIDTNASQPTTTTTTTSSNIVDNSQQNQTTVSSSMPSNKSISISSTAVDTPILNTTNWTIPQLS